MNPIKICQEWLLRVNLNTVKFFFCKVAVPLVTFVVKDVKITNKRQNGYPALLHTKKRINTG